MEIHPLDILLVDRSVAPLVAVPANDLLSGADRRRILADEPLSFLHAIRLPRDYPPDGEPDPDRHLRDSSAALRRMVSNGVFRRVGGPALFIYRLTAGDHRQTAVVADVPVRVYDDGRVLRHEETRVEKQSGLCEYLETVGASSSPVCLTYRPVAAIDALVTTITAARPDLDFTTRTGTRQEVWVIEDLVTVHRLTDRFRDVPHAYITDGHHRAAATAETVPNGSFLAALFPADQMRMVAHHRYVRGLGRETPAGLLQSLRDEFDIWSRPVAAEPPVPARGKIVMCLDGRWYELYRRGAGGPDLAGEPDVVTLQERILAPLLGIDDPRSDPRLAYMTSRIAPEAIAGRADSAPHTAAFLLHPMSLEQLMALSHAGHTLPPKSTWFTPKAGAGIFLRFDDG